MMQGKTILNVLAVASVGVFVAACREEATSPTSRTTQLNPAEIVSAAALPEAFAIRAPLGEFFVNQMPELMFRSSVTTELIIQRLVTAPTPGSWHTHTGPAFGIVDEGTVIIHRYSKKHGCVSTPYTKGQTYIEEAGEIHRAEVPQPATAVEYKARFYLQPGAPLSTPAADPCGTAK